MTRRLAAEAIGTGLLIVAVIGSGIMAERMTDIVALQLLCNAIATGGALVALILIFAPVSGASFNPVVGIVGIFTGEATVKDTLWYALAQTVGGCFGAIVANLMFDLDAINISHKIRSGSGILFSEVVATVGLLLVIYGTIRAKRSNLVPFTVAAWITGAYFFTSSTSLANPAVTVARSLSDTFAGIAPESVPMFIVMQVIGAIIAIALIQFVFQSSPESKS
ncbi:MAG: aquaporin family protein [Actinobacteria bacterium]|nr:MAG: aquaporin family protein [Actinomycetota bacterium]